MTRRIAALSCWLSLVQGSVVAAEDIITKRPALLTAAVANAAPQAGPIRRASLAKDTRTILSGETRWAVRPIPDGGRDRGPWMEGHPVWAGALVGFGAGFLLTYAVAHDDDDEFITVISPAAAALFWGGVSAGVGALAGWGIGRNRDDADRDSGGSDSEATPSVVDRRTVITFTDRLTELNGSVQDAGGQPEPEYHVVVFARDKTYWTAQSRQIRSLRPAADGKYVIPNLPPGEYLMTAVMDMEPDEQFDAAVLELLSRSAVALTLGEGEKKTQNLRLAGQLP